MGELIESFNKRFLDLHLRSLSVIEATQKEELFVVRSIDSSHLSIGESIIRSAGIVEQAFGGIMTRLWDDPFEWTLPEELSTRKKILDYLAEVETTRENGFAFFLSDEDLKKEISTPNGMRSLVEILGETIEKAEHQYARVLSELK